MKSLRASFGKRYPELLKEGLRSRFASNDRRNPVAAFPTHSVARMSDLASQPRLVKPSKWWDAPKSNTFGDIDDDFGAPWSNEGQGLTYGWGHWFITDMETVYRIPDSPGFTSFRGDTAYISYPWVEKHEKQFRRNHLGDPSFDASTGLLYVPLEGVGDLNKSDVLDAVLVFTFDLTWIGFAELLGFPVSDRRPSRSERPEDAGHPRPVQSSAAPHRHHNHRDRDPGAAREHARLRVARVGGISRSSATRRGRRFPACRCRCDHAAQGLVVSARRRTKRFRAQHAVEGLAQLGLR